MITKVLGITLVIVSCIGLAFLISAIHKREVQALKQFLAALDYMECELQYRRTPLPQLCRETASVCSGFLATLFKDLANELDNQISPDAKLCMDAVLTKYNNLPPITQEKLVTLGTTLGRFDLEGQVRDLRSVHDECSRLLDHYTENENLRLRNTRTLCICAGIAIAVVLI